MNASHVESFVLSCSLMRVCASLRQLSSCTVVLQVMVVPKQQRRLMKAALEMAVQQSLSHPNIVRVYAVLTDMCQESGRSQLAGHVDSLVGRSQERTCMDRCMHTRPYGAP